MWLRLHRIERGTKLNVNGKVVSRRYCYLIIVYRWFKKPRYLRLLPGWFDAYLKNEPIKVELTRMRGQATEFREDSETSNYLRKSIAEGIVAAIRKNPNQFILN